MMFILTLYSLSNLKFVLVVNTLRYIYIRSILAPAASAFWHKHKISRTVHDWSQIWCEQLSKYSSSLSRIVPGIIRMQKRKGEKWGGGGGWRG